MVKTISIEELGRGGASRAVRDAREAPVLISKADRPVAWLISAEKLAEAAAGHGPAAAAAYQRALELFAVELFDTETISLERGAKLAGLSLDEFIDLCGKVGVSILREPVGGLQAEVEAARAMATKPRSDA